MNSKNWIDQLKTLNICDPALHWCEQQYDAQTAWEICLNPGWKLWLIVRLLDKSNTTDYDHFKACLQNLLLYIKNIMDRLSCPSDLKNHYNNIITDTVEQIFNCALPAYTAVYADFVVRNIINAADHLLYPNSNIPSKKLFQRAEILTHILHIINKHYPNTPELPL